MGLPAGTKKAEHFCPAVSTEGCFSLAVERVLPLSVISNGLGRALLPKGETGAFPSRVGQGGNKVSK